VGLLGALVVLALPAAAAASTTLTVDRPCYTPGQAINVAGAGYTPGGQVAMLASLHGRFGNDIGMYEHPLTPDVAGNIGGRLRAPDLASSDDTEEQVTLTANDQQRIEQNAPPEEQFGAAVFKLSVFGVAVAAWDRGRVDPRKATTFTAYGFEGLGPVLYEHYLLRGKLVKTVRLGALSGDCANLTKKMKQFPFRPVPPGDYRVDFDTSPRYSPRAEGVFIPHVKVSRSKAVR
jgi:hypothetical protein